MRLLRVYSGTVPFQIGGHLALINGQLQVSFRLEDNGKVIQDSLSTGRWPTWARADELWKTTCLEVFLAVPEQLSYWELNFSPGQKKWNLYHFNEYRKPQPPKTNYDFELVEVVSTESTFDCILSPNIPLKKLQANLCAVIRTGTECTYHAFNHAPSKPDFHYRDTMSLELCPS